jgi:hypothetical protein
LPGALDTGFFQKKWKTVFADGRPQALGTKFLKNITPLFADVPWAVGKEDFKKP